jgi:non-ribosomal peptide synthase protein (TIGR01720 family)
VWFDAGPEEAGLLLIAVHHLAVDGVSWRILLPDLQTAWDAVAVGATPMFGPKGTSFRAWAEQVAADAVQPARVDEADYWESVLAGAEPLVAGALDPARDTIGQAGRCHRVLPGEITEAVLTRVAAAFHGGVNDVLLGALAVAVARWQARRDAFSAPVVVEVEGHGREEIFADVDLSRTMGWFTTVYPVRLAAPALDESELCGPTLGAVVKAMKEQLRAVPDGGLGYGELRYLNATTASRLAAHGTPQLGFNYLGRIGVAAPAGLWGLVPQPAGSDSSDAAMPLAHVIEVNAITEESADGPRLTAHWMWAPALVDEAAVSELAREWFDALAALAAYTIAPEAGGLTPSDVTLAGLTQDEIDRLERGVA